jgi:hypothetical protein
MAYCRRRHGLTRFYEADQARSEGPFFLKSQSSPTP